MQAPTSPLDARWVSAFCQMEEAEKRNAFSVHEIDIRSSSSTLTGTGIVATCTGLEFGIYALANTNATTVVATTASLNGTPVEHGLSVGDVVKFKGATFGTDFVPPAPATLAPGYFGTVASTTGSTFAATFATQAGLPNAGSTAAGTISCFRVKPPPLSVGDVVFFKGATHAWGDLTGQRCTVTNILADNRFMCESENAVATGYATGNEITGQLLQRAPMRFRLDLGHQVKELLRIELEDYTFTDVDTPPFLSATPRDCLLLHILNIPGELKSNHRPASGAFGALLANESSVSPPSILASTKGGGRALCSTEVTGTNRWTKTLEFVVSDLDGNEVTPTSRPGLGLGLARGYLKLRLLVKHG